MGTKIASKAHRDGVAERLADPAVQKSLEVDLALITSDDALLRDVERPLVTTATHHDAQTLSLLHTVPGLGKILRLVRLDDRHDLERFPRGPAFASSWRLVQCAKASAGESSRPPGGTSGHAPLTWGLSQAAAFCLRGNPAAQPFPSPLEDKQNHGKTLTLLAPSFARAG